MEGILIAIIIGVFLGSKYGEVIIGFIFFSVVRLVKMILSIISIPQRLTFFVCSDERIQNVVSREYDRALFEIKSMKRIRSFSKRIWKLELLLKEQKLKKHDKETIKWLNESKWLI